MLVAAVAICEIAFWVFVVAGLAARYLLRRRRTGAVLLACVPLLDLALVVCALLDLRGGTPVNGTHGLAAAYFGFTVVFGPGMIRWADQRFAHRFAGGPPPRPRRTARERIWHEWREWFKAVLACVLAIGLLVAGAALVADPVQAQALLGWIPNLAKVLGVWLIWAVVATIWPGGSTGGKPAPVADQLERSRRGATLR